MLGPEVFIAAGNYRLEHRNPVMDQSMDEGDVVIGDDVLLGARAMVIAGVEIGSGSVVAANSFVTRMIPPGRSRAAIRRASSAVGEIRGPRRRCRKWTFCFAPPGQDKVCRIVGASRSAVGDFDLNHQSASKTKALGEIRQERSPDRATLRGPGFEG